MSDESKKFKPEIRFKVAHGQHRGHAKNDEWSDAKLWKILNNPQIDRVTSFRAYQRMDVDERGKVKARAGWYKFGYYKDGLRKAAMLKGVSCIALDLDNATHEQIDHILSGDAEISRWKFFAHTTRSHSPEKPRWRIILFMDRLADLDEANAIGRYIALELDPDPDVGINIPDQVSFRPNQISYRPSHSEDQEYLVHRNEGDIIDVDGFLDEIEDWRDVTTLPLQEGEKSAGLRDPNQRMEDPREKPGWIGAFCRTYSISEAIEEFIPEVYVEGEAGTDEARYTYTAGSASNGAVVYDDDTFIYSNHGTDPIEGAANAWDMVRLHKFGDLDAKSRQGTSPANLPSAKKMVEMVSTIPEVAAEMSAPMIEMFEDYDSDEEDDAEDDEEDESQKEPETVHDKTANELADLFDDLDAVLAEEDDESTDSGDLADEFDDDDDDEQAGAEAEAEHPQAWATQFRRKDDKVDGKIEPVAHNISLICRNDTRITKALAYNEFTFDPVALVGLRSKGLDLPSTPVRKSQRAYGRRWEDHDDDAVLLMCSAPKRLGGYHTDFSKQNIQAGVIAGAKLNTIHPVKDKITALHRKWVKKGKPTGLLDRLPQEFFGCPDDEFHRESSAMFCIAAIARIFEPGCKFDQMAIIEGPTGSGKSTYWSYLFLGFIDELKCDLHQSDRVIEGLRGRWAVEMAEMTAAKKADSNTLKMQLSSSSDTHRLAYAKREQTFDRQSVFVGTSNEADYLTDPTSTRRYWVWRTEKDEHDQIDRDRLKASLWMIWGEAYQRYLDWREMQPKGELVLDLQTDKAKRQRDKIALGSRKLTVKEIIAERIEEFLNEPTPAEDFAGITEGPFDQYEGDDTPMVWNMISPEMLFEALSRDPELASFRDAHSRTYTTAVKDHVQGWTYHTTKCRRHGMHKRWFTRDAGPGLGTTEKPGPLIIPASTIHLKPEPEPEDEDELDLDDFDFGLDDL